MVILVGIGVMGYTKGKGRLIDHNSRTCVAWGYNVLWFTQVQTDSMRFFWCD